MSFPGTDQPAAPAAGSGRWPNPGGLGRPTGPGGQPLAEWWERLLARLLDNLVISGVLVIGEFLAAIPLAWLVVTADGRPPVGEALLGGLLLFAILGAIYGIATYVYEVVLFGGTGHTLGKRVLKLQVVAADGGAPADRRQLRRRWLAFFGPSVLSYLVLPLALVLWVYELYDVLSPLWDRPDRQALHDKFAGTVVVKDPSWRGVG